MKKDKVYFYKSRHLDGFFYILPYGVIKKKWYNDRINKNFSNYVF